MPLDQAKVQKVDNWIHGKGGAIQCPICDHHHWLTGDIVAPPALRDDGRDAPAGEPVPMVQVVCGNCAYVMLFAAAAIGL